MYLEVTRRPLQRVGIGALQTDLIGGWDFLLRAKGLMGPVCTVGNKTGKEDHKPGVPQEEAEVNPAKTRDTRLDGAFESLRREVNISRETEGQQN